MKNQQMNISLNKLNIFTITLISSLLISQAAFTQPSQIPLETAFAVKPNVMVLLDNSTSMSSNFLPDTDGEIKTRFQVAKNAITELIEQSHNVRFCLSVFQAAVDNSGWQSNGGYISDNMQCTSDTSQLIQEIDSLPIITASTPLSETYYDVTRYFRGQAPYFGNFDKFDSPIQQRCQTNSVIVITDGEPQLDWDRKSIDTPIDLSSESGTYSGQSRTLPNWDNVPPDGTQHVRNLVTGLFPVFSDGSCGTVAGCDPGAVGTSYALFLDDLALFGLQKDLAPGLGSSGDFQIQHLKTHTIGLEVNIQMLEDAAFYGDGDYTEATSSIELRDALQNTVVTSVERRGSGAHAMQSDIALDADGHTNLYLTHYDTKDWSGDLIKVQLEEQADHSLSATKIWSAAEKLDTLVDPVTSRTIFTPNDSITELLDFKSDGYTSSLSNSQLEIINQELNAEGEFEEAINIVDYVRGKTSLNSDQYRPRSSLMGDLVHSRAAFVKNRNYGYKDEAYATYLMDNTTRQAMIYVGGNDGMLHAFDESTGDEKFAYVPNSVLDKLNRYRSTSYTENHLYFVDGELSIVDAKLKRGSTFEWATVLASPLGAGHKGLFLLDVTFPHLGLDSLRSNLFKWEINNTTEINGTEVFKRMGFIINSPKIVRFRIPDANNNFHDKWVLITGNGVHSKFSDQGKTLIGAATVLIIDLDTGELITELVVDNGFVDQIQSTTGAASYEKFTNGNGITSIAAVDVDINTYIDRLYAADLKGNLWRFDYDDNGTILGDDAAYINANLKIAYETSEGLPGPIFTASGGEHPKPYIGSYPQPITAELTVTAAPASSEVREGEMVFFGTGQYFDFTHLLDGVNNKVQSMYAFWDRGGWDTSSTPKTRLDLQEQIFVETTVDGEEVRAMSAANSIDYTTKLGWFMDMPARGERITRKSVGLFEHMAFFTQSPISNIDPCVEGIDGWSMIAKKDTATPLAVTIAGDAGITTKILGNKYTGDSIHDPIFVELSDNQFVAPIIIDAVGSTPTISNTTHIQKDYSRASWKRLQL